MRSDITAENAHDKGTEIGSVQFSIDGRTVLSRGVDGTVKRKKYKYIFLAYSIQFIQVWDLRNIRSSVSSRRGLTTLYPTTNAIFSPDEMFILTGISASTKGGKGKLLILAKNGLETVKDIEMGGSPVRAIWHPKINQDRYLTIR